MSLWRTQRIPGGWMRTSYQQRMTGFRCSSAALASLPGAPPLGSCYQSTRGITGPSGPIQVSHDFAINFNPEDDECEGGNRAGPWVGAQGPAYPCHPQGSRV